MTTTEKYLFVALARLLAAAFKDDVSADVLYQVTEAANELEKDYE